MNIVPFEEAELNAIALLNPKNAITKTEIREHIVALESSLLQYANPDEDTGMVLKEFFAPGMYARELFIPKGILLTGKIHRHAHINILASGIVSVLTETAGSQLLEGPLTMVSAEGTKRALFTHEDTIWITVHLTDKTNISDIESEIIATGYNEIEITGELL